MAGRRRWALLRQELLDDPEARASYEAARQAFELGEQVRRLRTAAGFSQTELAHRARTTRSAVARIEEGGGASSIVTLTRVSEALDAELVIALRPRHEPVVTGEAHR